MEVVDEGDLRRWSMKIYEGGGRWRWSMDMVIYGGGGRWTWSMEDVVIYGGGGRWNRRRR